METTMSKRKQMERLLEEMATEIWETVCEDLCKWNDEQTSEHSRWENHCKDCPLWKLL